MTLTEYIKKRNGVSIGSPKSLGNNLYRSLGKKFFFTFWNYWNPVFGLAGTQTTPFRMVQLQSS